MPGGGQRSHASAARSAPAWSHRTGCDPAFAKYSPASTSRSPTARPAGTGIERYGRHRQARGMDDVAGAVAEDGVVLVFAVHGKAA